MSSSIARTVLPTLVGLLSTIRWCVCHHASCAVSTLSTNALASDSLSAGGPLGLIGLAGLPSFGCSHCQWFSTSRRRQSVIKLGHLPCEPEDLVEFFCQRLSSLSLAMPSIQPADKIECSKNAGPAGRSSDGALVQRKGESAMKGIMSLLALAVALPFTGPAFAGDVKTVKTEADCKKLSACGMLRRTRAQRRRCRQSRSTS